MTTGTGAKLGRDMGFHAPVVTGELNNLDQIIKGMPIVTMVRIKPNDGYQKDDIRFTHDRIQLMGS